ncbi:hypothetical protein ACFQ2B_31385 [Streptomyces stramineus]
MCEILDRIWSRPRGEWTRVLRRELPALAAQVVDELQRGTPRSRRCPGASARRRRRPPWSRRCC